MLNKCDKQFYPLQVVVHIPDVSEHHCNDSDLGSFSKRGTRTKAHQLVGHIFWRVLEVYPLKSLVEKIFLEANKKPGIH